LRHSVYTRLDEISAWVWQEVHRTGNLLLLIKKKRWFGNLRRSWDDLNNRYIQEIGLNPRYISYLEKIRQQTINICDSTLNNDTMATFKREVMEAELEDFLQASGNHIENHAILEKFMGFRIDLKTTSVLEYEGMIKLFIESGKKSTK
jgi:hypothetical protein